MIDVKQVPDPWVLSNFTDTAIWLCVHEFISEETALLISSEIFAARLDEAYDNSGLFEDEDDGKDESVSPVPPVTTVSRTTPSEGRDDLAFFLPSD